MTSNIATFDQIVPTHHLSAKIAFSIPLVIAASVFIFAGLINQFSMLTMAGAQTSLLGQLILSAAEYLSILPFVGVGFSLYAIYQCASDAMGKLALGANLILALGVVLGF